MGDKVLDQSGLGAIYFLNSVDGDCILDGSHEC